MAKYRITEIVEAGLSSLDAHSKVGRQGWELLEKSANVNAENEARRLCPGTRVIAHYGKKDRRALMLQQTYESKYALAEYVVE